MSKKLDFKSIKTGRTETVKSDTVYQAIEKGASAAGQQVTASAEEIQERRAEMRTQGRKGAKATRINMAFAPDNYNYIKVMSRISGQTLTEFVNEIIVTYRQQHDQQYKQALNILNNL
jgi:hypothetical protein